MFVYFLGTIAIFIILYFKAKKSKPNLYALDCEMVGGYNGRSILGRVVIVDCTGYTVYDEYVKPCETVVDYRTWVSGLTEYDLEYGREKNIVRNEVAKILKGNILIGHSLHFDLNALNLIHPWEDIRDLATYRPLTLNGQPVALRKLAALCLGRNIQSGIHDPTEDAKASMDLYQMFASSWEQEYNN